jgi:hypothetical protein
MNINRCKAICRHLSATFYRITFYYFSMVAMQTFELRAVLVLHDPENFFYM